MKSRRTYKVVLILHLLITFCSCALIRSTTSTEKSRHGDDDDGDGLLKHVDDAMMDVFASILDGPDSTEDKKSSSEETKRSASSEETQKPSSSEDIPIVAKADNRTTNSFNVQRNSSASDSVLPPIPIFPGSMFLSPSMASRLTSTMNKRKRMNGNSRSPFPTMGRNMAGIFPQQNPFALMQRPMPPMLQLGAGRLMAQDFLHRPGMNTFLPIISNTMTRPGSPFGPSGTGGFDASGIPNSSSFSSNLNTPNFASSSSDLSGGMSSLGGGMSGLGGGMSGLSGGFGGLGGGMSGLSGGFGGLSGGMSGFGGGFGGLGGGMSGLGGGMSGLGGGMSGLGGGMSGLGGGMSGLGGRFDGLGGMSGLGGGMGGLSSGFGGLGGGMSSLGGFGGLGGGMSSLGGFGGLGGGMSGLGGGMSGLGGGFGGLSGGFGGLGGGTSSLTSTLSGMSGLGLQNPALRFGGGSGVGSGVDFSGGDSQTSGFGMGSNRDNFNLAQRPLDLAKNSSMSMFGAGNSFGANPMLGMGLGLNRMPLVNPLLLQQAGLLGLNRQLLAQARPNPLLLQSLLGGGGSPGLTPMIQPGGMLSLQPQNSFLDASGGRTANSFDNMFRPNRTFDVLSGGVFSGSNREVTKMAGKELPEKARVVIEPVSQLSSPAITEASTTTLPSTR